MYGSSHIYLFSADAVQLLLFLVLIALSIKGYSEDVKTVRLNMHPNIWFPQTAIIKAMKWDVEAGLQLEPLVVSGPIQSLQTFVAGSVEGMNSNSASILLAHERGVPLRIVTTTYYGDISLVAHGNVVGAPGTTAIEKLRSFRAHVGRKPILVNNPRGSLSEITIKRWLEEQMPDYADHIEIIEAGDQAQMQQIFLSGRADLCSAFGSLLWLFKKHDPSVEEIASPDEVSRDQPGGVLVVRKEYAERNPDVVLKLRALYRKADELMRNDPEAVVEPIDRFLTSRFLPKSILRESLDDRRRFIGGDPSHVRKWLSGLAEYMLRRGYIKSRPNLDELLAGFDESGSAGR